MPRPRRHFAARTSYHVTMRCNARAFDLQRPLCRQALLLCLARARARFGFRLHAVSVMSNHVHYLIRPERPDDMVRIMHWLNWYSAMLLNRLLGRRGHFWEGRYHAVPVPDADDRHALAVLRYIHANALAASLVRGFRYRYADYASYADARPDGLTDWHPAFLRLDTTLAACARRYVLFCRRYRPMAKPARPDRWGHRRLWTLYSAQADRQTEMFAPAPAGLAPGVRRGKKRCQARWGVTLRAGLLAEVLQFCRVNA